MHDQYRHTGGISRTNHTQSMAVTYTDPAGHGIEIGNRWRDEIAWHTTCTMRGGYPSVTVSVSTLSLKLFWRRHMKWTTPSYTEMRFGFEVTMYIANR